jgi:thiamine transporter ThiT
LKYRTRRIAAAGLFAALALAVTYPMAGIPNIKFFELCLFISGAFLGYWGGLTVPLVAGTIYILFNPNGPQTVLLVGLAQIIGFILFGLAGALFRKMILVNKNRIVGMTFCAATAVVLTFIYDFMTNAAFGFTIGAFWPTIVSGIGFSLVHMASNGLIFGLAEPLMVKLWQVSRPYLYSA